MNKILVIFFMLTFLLLLVSCSNPQEKYENDYKKNNIMGEQICKNKNLEYNAITTKDLITWETECYTISPLKFYKFKI